MIFCCEDFMDFPLSEFPYDKGHTALGEYHFFVPKGYKGNWYDPVALHQWRGNDGTWLVTESNNKHYMEQNRGKHGFGAFTDLVPILIYRSEYLKNYTLSCDIIMYKTKYLCGLTFKYIHGLKCYNAVFEDQKIRIYYKNPDSLDLVAEADFKYESLKSYNLKIDVCNNLVKVYIDDIKYLEVVCDGINEGKTGLYSTNFCAYTNYVINMDDKDYLEYTNKLEEYKKKLETKKYPKLELIKKIDLGKYGTARQVGFFEYNNKNYVVLAQHQKRVYRDSYAHISCLCAMDFEGNVLWHVGEPSNCDDNTLISADLPFQIYDVDNDSKPEVIFARNFKVYILDALTGNVKREMLTPIMDEYDSDYPFDRLNVDAIRVADFTKKGYKSDFIIKDRYKNVFAFDSNFKLLFRYNHKNTGHFPFIYDFDDDGIDEMFVGYDMVKDGKIKWSLSCNSDHTDEIIYAKLSDDLEPCLVLSSGNEGFNIANMDGTFRHHRNVGHAQRISVAKYDNSIDGLQICVTSFWGNNGIIYLYDKDANLLAEKEYESNGNVICPILYDGKNTLILLNGNDGIVDSNLDLVIKFPEDNHPTLCADAMDLDNDGIDEIILWDQKSMYIYKSSEFVVNNNTKRYPHYAKSNYRGEFIFNKK